VANKGYVEIFKDGCKGCGLCVKVCPVKCLAIVENDTNCYGLNYACLKEKDKCIGCANCGVVCPDAVITVFRTPTKLRT